MQSAVPRNFFSIEIESLIDNSQANFDVYTLLDVEPVRARAEDYVVYARAPYRWTARELGDLMKVGVTSLYVEESQRNLFARYQQLKEVKEPAIDETLEPRFRLRQIQDVGSHLIEAAILTSVDERLLQYMTTLSRSLVTCLQEDPRVVAHVRTLGEHSLYTYIHCAGVSVLAPAIAMQMGESNVLMLTHYALAGLLHDVGKKRVPLAVLDKTGPLRPEEWNIMRAHPGFGVEELEGLGAPPLVMSAIGSHHEKLDGSGYPHGLSASEISEATQIVTVADIFSALTTSRCYHFKRSRFEALMFMKHELVGKVSKDAFKALVQALVVEEEVKQAG